MYLFMCLYVCVYVCVAVYLCKRTMQNKQRLELADYEAENLARLQKTFSRKWEFIFMQAEAQAKSVTSTYVRIVRLLFIMAFFL